MYMFGSLIWEAVTLGKSEFAGTTPDFVETLKSRYVDPSQFSRMTTDAKSEPELQIVHDISLLKLMGELLQGDSSKRPSMGQVVEELTEIKWRLATCDEG